GKMAFIRSPDQISVELLQEGDPLPPQEPWLSMPSQGEW
ncbi:MAG: lactoylglutathione lyase, partial [SAR324 cluster bacterium]|nr:lactoylglutathione lyase [SAR324 cluster bacterium]